VTDARELIDHVPAVLVGTDEDVIDLPALERRERAATRREQQARAREDRRIERLRRIGIACCVVGAILGVIGLAATVLG
jgi:hypothetical protein